MRIRVFGNTNCLIIKDSNNPIKSGLWEISFTTEAINIGLMISTLSQMLLVNIKPFLDLPYTEEISVSAFDSDSCSTLIVEEKSKISLAKPNDELGRGYNIVTLSRSKLLSLKSTIERNQYILDSIYLSLKEYLILFNFQTDDLEIAYEKVKSRGFYLYSGIDADKAVLIHKKYNLRGGVQMLMDIDWCYYRFALVNVKTLQLELIIELPKKMHKSEILQGLDSDTIAKTKISGKCQPYMFQNNGWKRDKFYFQWGIEFFGPSEKYEFDYKTREIKRLLE